MRIGIVSDTHGKAKRLAVALRVFAERRVEAIVHCGDVGSQECVRLLGSAGVPAHVVLGNMDRRENRLIAAAEGAGVHIAWEAVEVPIGPARHVVAVHGHDKTILGELIADQQFPYVCHGHTHKPRDERIGSVRVINPGALHHASRYTVAVLDTDTDGLEHIRVD